MSSVEETGQSVIQASLEGDCLEVESSPGALRLQRHAGAESGINSACSIYDLQSNFHDRRRGRENARDPTSLYIPIRGLGPFPALLTDEMK